MLIEVRGKIGLDHSIRREYLPHDRNERIIKELSEDEDTYLEDIFTWRKDYELHDFFIFRADVVNGEQVKISEKLLIEFLEYLEEKNGKDDENWEGEIHDYEQEILYLKEVILLGESKDYQYYYWAWW